MGGRIQRWIHDIYAAIKERLKLWNTRREGREKESRERAKYIFIIESSTSLSVYSGIFSGSKPLLSFSTHTPPPQLFHATISQQVQIKGHIGTEYILFSSPYHPFLRSSPRRTLSFFSFPCPCGSSLRPPAKKRIIKSFLNYLLFNFPSFSSCFPIFLSFFSLPFFFDLWIPKSPPRGKYLASRRFHCFNVI